MRHAALEFLSTPLVLGSVAASTHYLLSFCQTVFHRRLGHRRVGGRLFRNHVRWHHVYYAKDHMVSAAYRTEHGNNTPFFLIPTAVVAGATWWLLPLDLFVVHAGALALSFYAHVYLDVQYHVAGSWLGRFGWFRRKQQLHFVHHRQATANFAVIDFFWDRLLATFQEVDPGELPSAPPPAPHRGSLRPL